MLNIEENLTIEVRRHRHVVSLLACAILLLNILRPLTTVTAVPEASTPGRAVITLAEQDDGHQVVLTQNQELVVRLEANPSTGYLWEVAGMDNTILREVGQVEFEPESAGLGAPATLVRRFEAVGPGQSNLALVYRRPWEKAEPARTFSVQVQGVGPFTHVNSPSIPSATPVAEPVAGPTVEGGSSAQALPSSFNWCSQGGCTPIKDQGQCGSCWAFATVGPLESLIKLKDGVERDLSEQYLLSCNTDGWSCSGGWWAHDYHQYQGNVPPGEPAAGAVYEADFSYVASKVSCNPPHTHHEKIASWAYVGSSSTVPPVANLKQAIRDHGPVSVAMCVGSAFNYYSGGIFQTNETSPCGGGVNHGVVLVGWDDTQAGGVWILRNSWGPGWGEGGYMRIKYGTSNVGYGASYVVYEGDNVPPAAPSSLQATPASQTQINLKWNDTSTNEAGFRIERSLNGSSSWSQIATVGANVTTYANTGLVLSKTYYYRVWAYNAFGDSGYSNVAQAKTAGPFTSAMYLPVAFRNNVIYQGVK
jgi:inhibitor of cysteine peptidase